jgi:DNA mismatch repair protein MutS
VLRDDERIEIRGGRHPVLDALGGDEPFVPNDFVLGDEESGRVAILTGPNMAGKSTYIRQVALIVLMAQIGSEVPAELAEVGLCDRIFTRIGSADDLTRGLSTFMVEMVETSNILNNATAKSLVVLDEVGRGTSTYDGVSIAWAMTEYLYDRIGARTLFATHYHELTGLSSQRAGVRNYSVAVREWQDEIIFLRKIVAGGADKSYGIQVARLAGVPGKVIDRARVILDELEQGSFDLQGRPLLIRSSAELESSATRQLSLFETPPDPLRERLDELDIDRLSPIDALLALKQLQELAKES